MTKKQRKFYRKLLAKKLTELGVKDEITYKPTNATSFALFVKDEQVAGGRVEPKQYQQQVRMMQAQNLQRHIMKTLIRAGEEAVIRFLNSDIEVKNIKEEPAPAEEGAQNENVQI